MKAATPHYRFSVECGFFLPIQVGRAAKPLAKGEEAQDTAIIFCSYFQHLGSSGVPSGHPKGTRSIQSIQRPVDRTPSAGVAKVSLQMFFIIDQLLAVDRTNFAKVGTTFQLNTNNKTPR